MKDTQKFIEDMKQQTFGVEVEMNKITRQKAAETVAKYFGTEAWNSAFEFGYSSWACKDPQDRVWKFMYDSSINGPDYEKCELVTPILTYDDMETLQEIIRRLRKAGGRSDCARGCGVHIHIGADGHTPQTLRNLANIMASHEELLIKALRIDYYRISEYCKTVDPGFLKSLNAKKPKTMQELSDIWYTENNAAFERNDHYNRSRYHMLNYHATFTKGTIEFRLFQFNAPDPGTLPDHSDGHKNGLHAGRLKAYIQLCLALSQLAKKVKTASSKEQQKENPKYAMRTWLLRLGFIGEEFATARKFLTENLEGNSAFRNGRNAA